MQDESVSPRERVLEDQKLVHERKDHVGKPFRRDAEETSDAEEPGE